MSPIGAAKAGGKRRIPEQPPQSRRALSEAGRKGAAELWRKIRAGEPLGPPRKKKRGPKITYKGMGRRGGKSRAQALTPERRSEIARMGGLARKRKLEQRRREAEQNGGQQGAA